MGPFRVTAVPAIDGLGDPQLNWVVQADEQRAFHGGDTMFHGYWWLIARRFSPFDAVFLPANGAVVDAPHLQPPSPLPAAMTPRQEAVAAQLLDAWYTRRSVEPVLPSTIPLLAASASSWNRRAAQQDARTTSFQ